MPLASVPTKFSFILLWTLATFGGFLLSLLLIEISDRQGISVVESCVGGLAVALPQSLLRKQSTYIWRWVLSTLLGWGVMAMTTGAVGWIVPTPEFFLPRLLWGTTLGVTSGFGLGLAQWWLAIPKSDPWAWQWIVVSSVSWTVALPVGWSVGLFLHHLTRLYLGEVVGLALTWLIVSILTGIKADKFFG